MTLAKKIIAYRTQEEISQVTFAARAGVDRTTIWKAESGRNVSKLTESKIERVLEESKNGKA
jgi:DNA-binding XRE family transcriptional regulator